MAWITIVEADILTVMSGAELEAIRAAALKLGQADPVAPTIAQVTDHVRGFVGGCKSNQLGPAGTIPQKLLATALDLLAVRIPLRVNISPKSGRKDAAEAAGDLLKLVAKCDFDIEEPGEITEEESFSKAGKPSIKSCRERQFDRRSQDGI